MKISAVLLLAWFVALIFWLLNHYHRANTQYEREYREGKRPKW